MAFALVHAKRFVTRNLACMLNIGLGRVFRSRCHFGNFVVSHLSCPSKERHPISTKNCLSLYLSPELLFNHPLLLALSNYEKLLPSTNFINKRTRRLGRVNSFG